MEQPTFADLEYAHKKRKTRREKFLERMEELIPWAELEARIAPYYPKAGRGRRPYPLSVMLRVHCVQLFYNLSDPGMEDNEVEPVRRFVAAVRGAAGRDDYSALSAYASGTSWERDCWSDQRASGVARLAAARRDGSGRDHHRGANVDQEPRGGARPGDAAGEEGEPVLELHIDGSCTASPRTCTTSRCCTARRKEATGASGARRSVAGGVEAWAAAETGA